MLSLVTDEKDHLPARHYLQDLMTLSRMPEGYQIHIESGEFKTFLKNAPRADMNVFGLGGKVNKEFMEASVKYTESACLFIRDSGQESALV